MIGTLAPAAIYSLMMIALWFLAFPNDEAMAHVFHPNAWAWAMFMHVAIVAIPPVLALNENPRERRAAWIVWGFALLLSMVGNISGSIAHALQIEMRAFWLLPAQAAGAPVAAVVAGAGGLFIVLLEGVVGYLWEASLSRAFAWFSARANERAAVETAETARAKPLQKMENVLHGVQEPLQEMESVLHGAENPPPGVEPLHWRAWAAREAGETLQAIAKQYGKSTSTISRWCKSVEKQVA